MAFRSSFWWACLCVLWLRDVSTASHYVLHSTRGSFRDALSHCSPGVLTTLATEQEVTQVLQEVLVKAAPHETFTFWVGLRKNNTECVIPALPLRGFRWTETGEQHSQVSQWEEEPAETCTESRCAALTGRSDGSNVTKWGLISVTCKNQYQYICKLKDKPTGHSTETSTPGAEPYSRPSLRQPEPTTPDVRDLTPTPSPGPDPCADGLQRDSSGRCVDINECSGAVCTVILNNDVDKGNGALSAILVPAVVAVVVLVALVVVVVVTVKCYLVRQAKRRTSRRAQKAMMKSKHEKTSKETTNEKAAT